MAHRSQTNELSSWFVRRCVGGGDTKPQLEAAQKQQKGGRGRQTDAAQPAEPPKKPSLPAAAAAAVAAVVHPDRKPKADGTEAADPKKQVQAQQQQQQHKQQQQAQQQQQQQQQQQAQQKQQKQQQKQQAAKPPSGSDSDSDSGSATRCAGRRRRSHDEARSEDEQQHKQQQRSADQEQQAAARQEEEEVDDRPRVLAYSDSDSDVESHFKRFERDVTQHLLPPSEEDAAAQAAAVEAAAAAAKAAEEAAAAAARRSPVRRLGSAAAGVVGAAARHLTPGLAVRAGGLLALQRVHPGVARAASAVSVAVPLAGAAATRAGLPLGAMLPRALQAAGRELGQFGQAAVALAVGRVLLGALRQHQRQRRQRRSQGQGAAPAEQVPVAVGQPVATPSGRLLRRKSSVNLAALVGGGDLSASIRQLNPQSSAEWAAVYAAEMREMRRMLQECEVQLPPERFDSSNAELFRFAKACGLTTAKTPEARAAAVEAGFSRVVHSVDWAARHRFMTDRELRRWDRLVAWKAHDASGRPILLARVGRAMQLVKPERYEEFTNALISLVHKGLSSQFSNAPGGAEQMVVVLDCRGGSSVGMTRHMGLLKKFAVTMTQHYPDRLFRLHLLELPLLLRWALHAVTPLLHPATRSKLVTSSINDPQLPVTVAFLSKRRSSYAKSLRRNFSNASFPSSGDSTPALLSPQPSQVGVAAVAAATAAVAAAPAALHAAAAGLPVGYQQQQQQQQGRQEQKDEDVPNTPPPTLKAPQSPHELASQRVVRRLSHERVALHARQHLHPGHAQQASDGKPHHSPHPVRHVALHARANLHNHAHPQQPASPPRHPQQAAASAPAAHVQQEAPPSPFARQAAQQRALSRGPFDAAAALPAVPGNQPQAAAAAAAQPTATLQPAGPAGGKAAAASAAAGPSSHAVPWSPGMQSPSGDLSRDSSFGEELVPAARAIAAAEAVREVDGAASAAGTAAAAGSSALASRRPPPLQHVGSGSSDTLTLTPTPLTTPGPRGLQQQQGSGSTPAAAEASSTTGSGPVGMWGIFAALMPALRSPGGSAITAAAAAEGSEPELLRRRSLLAHRIPSFTSSREPSPVTPYSARRRGGLGDLPEQPRRRTPGRGVTPRKSSLRRTVSASSEDSSRQPLESHPLRRQSSVSWAEELESIKEIQPHPEHASPNGPARWLLRAGLDSPLRQRLTAAAAAAGQQPPSVVLAMTMLLLMVVAMAERLLLSSVA